MLKAVFFDMDGVIIDTERDGHRVAFNETFEEYGLPVHWDEEEYHALLQIAGGKERMKHYFSNASAELPVPEGDLDSFVAELHKHKTARLIEMVRDKRLPLRPGVHRLMRETLDNGLKLAVCTTSNERFANAVLDTMLEDIRFDAVLAGDLVKRKKPDPEIYELALQTFNLAPEEALVVEDSANGVAAATRAGISVLVTTNAYTEQEDLSDASIIVDCLGEEGRISASVSKPEKGFAPDGIVHLSEVRSYLYEE